MPETLGKCCVTGFSWHGTPRGREDTVANKPVYIAGTNADRAILFVHDALGWTWGNARLLADHYAAEVDATVYLPDFFDGKPLSSEILKAKSQDDPIWATLDIPGFMKRNSKDIRLPEITAFAKELRTKHRKIGAVGYCWGGWACFALGAKGQNLIDCLSVSHPSVLTKEEIDAVDVPVQVNAPEFDGQYTAELKTHTLTKLVEKGTPFDYQYYPGQQHGFGTKGNDEDVVERRAMVRAKNATVGWFQNWLVVEEK